MTIPEYILKQDAGRQDILFSINSIILERDKTVTADVGNMMGKEMILYKQNGYFKYGLASVKHHMSMHIMPIYGVSSLHKKYQELLTQAEFQKGCINFKKDTDVPADVINQLFADCAKINIAAMLQNRKRTPKAKK
jgi:hypothetical protein